MRFANTVAEQAERLDAKEQNSAATIEVAPKSSKKETAPAKKEAAPIKKAPKRPAQKDRPRPAKRQKKETTPSEEEDEEEPTETSEDDEGTPVSEFDDSDISDAPKPKKKSIPKPKPTPKAKANPKAPAKRQTKKKAKVESDEEDTSESLSDIEDSDAPSTPPKQTSKTKALTKRKSKDKVVDSDEESEDEKHAKNKAKRNTPRPKNTVIEPDSEPEVATTAKNKDEEFETKINASGIKQYKSKDLVIVSDSESEEEFETKEYAAGAKNYKAKEPNRRPLKKKVDDSDDAETKAPPVDFGTDSEMSVVLDPEPKSKKQKPVKQSKPRQTQSGDSEIHKSLTADEQLIKTLQSQLLKCGVRKIWQFELKKCENDKAKIRHLQGMLKDIGMLGRFSEQRAREIKELRELQSELEAVREGEKAWGLESGKRASRSVKKNLKESSPEDEDEDEDDDKKGGLANDKLSKAAKAKQELAFLGDEESDSD